MVLKKSINKTEENTPCLCLTREKGLPPTAVDDLQSLHIFTGGKKGGEN